MQKKYYLLTLIPILIALWVIFGHQNADTPIRKNAIVVAFGDSLVVGQGSTEGNDFVSLLSKRLGVPIINKGVSGDTTTGGLLRLEKNVISQKPDVVILLLGGNDALRQVPLPETFQNLSAIIDRIQATGSKVLLLGIKGGLIGDPFKNEFERLSKAKNIPYVSNVLDGLFGDKRYMSDSIHPNDAGYAKIADRVEPELRKLLQLP